MLYSSGPLYTVGTKKVGNKRQLIFTGSKTESEEEGPPTVGAAAEGGSSEEGGSDTE